MDRTNFKNTSSNFVDKNPEIISEMFDLISTKYDLLNDLMTGLYHKKTRKIALELIQFSNKSKILDLATGTGDFAFVLQEKSKNSNIIGLDFSINMLKIAKSRAKKLKIPIKFIKGDILDLPFNDNTFEICTIGYGIRNVFDLSKALKETLRVTKVGGTFVIVEATPPPNKKVQFLANFYFTKIIPIIAKLLISTSTAYKYFGESVAQFPSAEKFCLIMKQSGWKKIRYFPLMFGSVTIFQGYK